MLTRYKILIPLIALLAILYQPQAMAMSDLADEFIMQCRQPCIDFPPDGWSDENIRTASLEVLDAYESGTGEGWTVYFCLVALGHVGNPDDLDRILAYSDTMPFAVIRSLHGYSHPEAVEFLLDQLDTDSASTREQVLYAIGAVDFESMDDPDAMRQVVMEKLIDVRMLEEFEVLIELIDDLVVTLDSGTGTIQ